MDGSVTNELQALSISNDTVFLTNGGFVKLPAGFDGQYSSLTGAPANVSAFTNDAGYLIQEQDTVFWKKDSTDIFYNAGNVGIGTTNPTSKLQEAIQHKLRLTAQATSASGQRTHKQRLMLTEMFLYLLIYL